MRCFHLRARCLPTLLSVIAGAPFAADADVPGTATQADARSTPGLHVTTASPHDVQQGKSGIDRFDLDISKVRESLRADGTTIVELNGEGMEQLGLTTVNGMPRMVCGSLLESRSATRPFTVDFRYRAVRKDEDDALR